MGTDAMLQYQNEQLHGLAASEISGLRVPNTFGFVPAKRLMLVEFVTGKRIEGLTWTIEDVVPACKLPGRYLLDSSSLGGGASVLSRSRPSTVIWPLHGGVFRSGNKKFLK
jgi:hypothetical protein